MTIIAPTHVIVRIAQRGNEPNPLRVALIARHEIPDMHDVVVYYAPKGGTELPIAAMLSNDQDSFHFPRTDAAIIAAAKAACSAGGLVGLRYARKDGSFRGGICHGRGVLSFYDPEITIDVPETGKAHEEYRALVAFGALDPSKEREAHDLVHCRQP